jgi:hypothetical protein
LYNYYKLIDNKKGQEQLIKLFNSPVGYLNKQLSNLKTISLLINNEKKPSKEDIIKAIYKIRDEIKPYKNILYLNRLHHLTLKKIDNRINETIKDLSDIINEETDKYIMSLK